MTATPLVLDVDQVAALLRCADTTVRERAHELGGIKLGRDYVFPVGALARRLDELALAAAEVKPTPSQPKAVLHALPVPAGRAKRKPPALPSLPAG